MANVTWAKHHPAGLAWRLEPLTAVVVDEYEAQWSDLAAHAAEKTIFFFPWFIRPSLPLLAGRNAKLLTLYQHDQLIGLLVICGDFGYAKLPVSFFRTALHYEQYLGTPLVRSGCETAFAAGLCAWLDDAPAKISFLLLASTSATGSIVESIGAQAAADNRVTLTCNRFERAAMILPPNHSATELTANRRKNLQRAMAKLSALGPVTFEQLTPRDTLEEWIEDFLAMENSGWKLEKGSSILSCPHETSLYRAMVPAARHHGALNFFRLCVAGKPIAYTLDVGCAPFGYCLKSAIDQDYKRFAPGVLMEWKSMEFYRQQEAYTMIDSCTAPDNALLNELWPDRKRVADIVIGRKSPVHGRVGRMIAYLKQDQSMAEAA